MDGNLSVLQDLLKSHSDLDLELNDNNGQTPLNIAARHGYLEVVEVLKQLKTYNNFLLIMMIPVYDFK